MSAVYRPMSISKKSWLVPLVLALVICIIYFNPRHSIGIIFDTKNGFEGAI